MTETLSTVTPIPMCLSVDPWWSLLTCLAFGHCDDGIGDERHAALEEDERIVLLLDEEGASIGFLAIDYAEIDPETLTSADVWDEGPRFDVPALGLTSASIGEILLAVRARYDEEEGTIAAVHFHLGINSEGEEAAHHFQCAVEAGEMKAHFALGYTLVELGRPQVAYSHLRRYTELVPLNSWAWCWLGRACAEMGEIAEARAAYLRAVDLEDDGSFATDAAQRLDALD